MNPQTSRYGMALRSGDGFRSRVVVTAALVGLASVHCAVDPAATIDAGSGPTFGTPGDSGENDDVTGNADSGQGSDATDAGTGPSNTDGGTGSMGGDDGGSGSGTGDGGTGSGSFIPCGSETQFIYTLDESNNLHRFYPPNLTFTTVGALTCPDISGPFSMAVDRYAQLWVLYSDGRIYKVNATTLACTATTFGVSQHGFTTFGMGFSSDTPGGIAETLFVSDDSGLGLASIDTTTLVLTPVGGYTGLTGSGLTGRAELTGNGNAELFGAFEGAPFQVAQINKTNAAIVSEAPQAPISNGSGGSNFAFAAWGSGFYLFQGSGGPTNVYAFSPDAGTTTSVAVANFEIVGAGVSTCAPKN